MVMPPYFFWGGADYKLLLSHLSCAKLLITISLLLRFFYPTTDFVLIEIIQAFDSQRSKQRGKWWDKEFFLLCYFLFQMKFSQQTVMSASEIS